MAKKNNNLYLRFTSLGLQMGGIIGGSVWLGVFLDRKYNPDGSVYTICLSLFGVFAALYIVIKEVMELSKNEDKDEE